MMSFSKVLIANRGEIAVRVARTCQRLGIQSVAVYSDADADALHVKVCDEAVHIGPPAPTESYLQIDKIIDAAKRTGAQAVHPGYGFLSENDKFADALEAAGLVFIGPTAETIRAMGSKSAAKGLMEAAGVPTTPGYQGEDQTLKTFKAEAKKVGYPILLKATAGGGGKGMRAVHEEGELKAALQSAKQEAKSATGDDRFLIEKYIPRARHLEVQIFGDGKGNVVHFYERDCSVQRRHQKVIEEAPAPNLSEAVRTKLLEAGVEAGKAVNYRGAGTVEFLYDGEDGVYFMEMNTRLQVEHPVTEEITGVDLVEWQLLVAAGAPLPLQQSEITASGHAFEARLYAENPVANFAPSIGDLDCVELPSDLARIDTGIAAGQTISTYYDPMISKIITHGADRASALGRMRLALNETAITGLETNSTFLAALVKDDAFAMGDVSTRYIEEHEAKLFAEQDIESFAISAFALQQLSDADVTAPGFRLNASPETSFWARVADETQLLRLIETGEGYRLERTRLATAADRRDGQSSEDLDTILFAGTLTDGRFSLTLDGRKCSGRILPHLGAFRVFMDSQSMDIAAADPRLSGGADTASAGSLIAPMPGVILAVHVNEGDSVEDGDHLASLEAMKMEHTISAPFAGTVKNVRFSPGEQVKDGDLLFDIEPAG